LTPTTCRPCRFIDIFAAAVSLILRPPPSLFRRRAARRAADRKGTCRECRIALCDAATRASVRGAPHLLKRYKVKMLLYAKERRWRELISDTADDASNAHADAVLLPLISHHALFSACQPRRLRTAPAAGLLARAGVMLNASGAALASEAMLQQRDADATLAHTQLQMSQRQARRMPGVRCAPRRRSCRAVRCSDALLKQPLIFAAAVCFHFPYALSSLRFICFTPLLLARQPGHFRHAFRLMPLMIFRYWPFFRRARAAR